MTNVFDEGHEPTEQNNSNTDSSSSSQRSGRFGHEGHEGRGFRGHHRGFGPAFRAGFGPGFTPGFRAGFGPGAGQQPEDGEPTARPGFPGFGTGFPFGGPGFPGRGGHFGPRGFRGGKGLGGHLGEVVLAERFARGEIDATEYRERVAVLREVQAEGRAAHEAARDARANKSESTEGRPTDA
jgi:hypothetical protein